RGADTGKLLLRPPCQNSLTSAGACAARNLRGDGAARADLKVSVARPDEEIVQRSLLPENPSNGGFPEPPPSMSVRIVAAKHEACGKSTRVRLPSAVPAR